MNSNRKPNPRIALHGGCSISTPSVNPGNWKTARASTMKDWYIFYRFYDPVRKPKGKPVMVKGMNAFKDPISRRQATQRLLDDEISGLKGGYNPVLEEWVEIADIGDLHEYTPLIKALHIALQKCTCVPLMKMDMKGTLTWVELAARKLNIQSLPVHEVRRKHIKWILDKCSGITERYDERLKKKIRVKWTDKKYNKYRAHLMMLFSEICQVEAIEANPVSRELKKKKTFTAKAQILTQQESNRVDAVLRWYVPEFWIFTNIFFHSGSRETEITQLRGKDIDLQRQIFTRIVKKDRVSREVETTIKDIALPFWQEAMKNCGPEDYIFGIGLKPSDRPIRADQINRRWRTWVKRPLGIEKDFYKLKHKNSTQTTAIAGDEAAAKHNAHKGIAVVRKIYDVERESREHEIMKKVNNPFAGQ